MTVKEDLRIIRTRKLLSNTLLDMMEEESIEKISVIDLCNRAMVNRATFYAHFEDKYHLLTFALEELKDELYAKFTKEAKLTTPTDTINSLMVMAIDFFFDKHNHIANIIRNNRNGKVVSTIEESIAHSIKYQLSKYKDSYDLKLPLQVISCFLAGGMVSTALLCIDNPGKYSQEEFLSYIANPITSNYFVKK
ncbi:MAG: TetR/AcrR family transcriptional regulator [Christensenellales bacterium]